MNEPFPATGYVKRKLYTGNQSVQFDEEREVEKSLFYSTINAETLRVLDSAPTYAPQGIRVYAGSESYASRLGTHVCPVRAYVYAPSRGATLEARDSGRHHLAAKFFKS